MEKNRTVERTVAVFCMAMIIGAVVLTLLLNLFGKLYEPKQQEPIKKEKIQGDSITVTCPACGMCIERELKMFLCSYH